MNNQPTTPQPMTDNNRPITPPCELVAKWITESRRQDYSGSSPADHIATQAARWGYEQRGAVNEAELQNARDEELEACCEWVIWELRRQGPSLQWSEDLCAARRPEPPSLKEQALALLDDASDQLDAVHENAIRRALEALDD